MQENTVADNFSFKLPQPEKILESSPGNRMLKFYCGGREVLRFEENGNIYVQERLAANDMEVVEAMRVWSASQLQSRL